MTKAIKAKASLRDRLLADRRKRKTVKVDIDEEPLDVLLMEPSFAEMKALEITNETLIGDLMIKVIIATTYDPESEDKMFSLDDYESVESLPRHVIEELFENAYPLYCGKLDSGEMDAKKS